MVLRVINDEFTVRKTDIGFSNLILLEKLSCLSMKKPPELAGLFYARNKSKKVTRP